MDASFSGSTLVADAEPGLLLRPALATVLGVVGGQVSVELYSTTGGAGFALSAPAIRHAAFAPGDTVLVVFCADDPDACVVVGRVNNAADALTAANVLALLVNVDGAGSGLDADTLDGSHESALLRADGTRPLGGDWDVGASRMIRTARVRARASDGLRLEESGGAVGLFVEQGGQVGVGNTAPADALDVTGNVRLSGQLYAGYGQSTADASLTAGRGRTGSGYSYVDLAGDTTYTTYGLRMIRENTGANARSQVVHRGTGELILRTVEDAPVVVSTQNTERLRVRNEGLAISGPGTVQNPQGILQMHDGRGGWLHTSKGAIDGTAQTLLADGTGDVTAYVRIDAVISAGSARAYHSFSLEQGGAMTQTITLGADSFQFRLHAAGSVDVRRTAGSSAGSVTARLMWM